MVQKFVKFIQKSPQRTLLESIVYAIQINHLEKYDIKPLIGKPGYFRLRSGSVRFIFKKTNGGNRIIKVDNRGDVYKR